MSNCRFLCYYCLKAFSSPDELTLHLSIHVHYTNKSLINCTIYVLNEKMWQKGFVDGILIDSAGTLLHSVQFKSRRETLNLADTNFCISSKPIGFEESMNANREESVFGHTLTKEFVITQSILARIYGQQEQGFKTLGHSLTSSYDIVQSRDNGVNLLYGELLPIGLDKALDPNHLDASRCKTLLELGSGIGKLAIQVFLQFQQITFVYGCEIFRKRYLNNVDAVLKLVELHPSQFSIVQQDSNSIKLQEFLKGEDKDEDKGIEDLLFDEKNETMSNLKNKRELHIEEQSLLNIDTSLLQKADIIILEAEIPACKHQELLNLIQHMHVEARILTYLNLYDLWNKVKFNEIDGVEINDSVINNDSKSSNCTYDNFPWKQLDINISVADRFATSWSPDRGHHFYLWTKL